MHELAHVVNVEGTGHNKRFHAMLTYLENCAKSLLPVPCPDQGRLVCPRFHDTEAVPAQYNRSCLQITTMHADR